MNVSKWFGVLVVGGGALALAGCGEEDPSGGSTGGAAGSAGSSSGGSAGSAGQSGASGSSAGAAGEAGSGGQPGDAGSCECGGSPVFCNGVCCMWMFGADAPCCDKL